VIYFQVNANYNSKLQTKMSDLIAD
jgi:hypothetical protein